MRQFALSCLTALLVTATSSASDFILRASSDCCRVFPDFPKGSMAVLFKDAKRVKEAHVSKDAPFVFKKVKAGKYDLVVSVPDCYPIKLVDIELGRDDVWDFELASPVRPTATPILEGQLTIVFKPELADSAILRKVEEFGLEVVQSSPRHKTIDDRIRRTAGHAEVRCTYDRSRNPAELMMNVLFDPTVMECTPTFFTVR